ncbi:hypothetical protein L7F22_040890 [Adiantum nelumboides]|nr:hypothetical protein [Adiantum nelumboides]
MEMEICAAGRPCMLVARFFRRHAHSRKVRHAHYNDAPAFVIPFRLSTLQPHNPLLCLSSRFKENTSQNAKGTRMIKVKFVLRRRCEFGQRFFVIGDDKSLGEWAPEAAIPMQWSEGHVWTLEMDLLSGTCMEFKILLKADEELIEWQPGPNCKLEVLDSVTCLLIYVPWSNGERLENDTLQFLERGDAQTVHDMVETASTAKSFSDGADNAENLDPVSDATSLLDVFDEPTFSADIETVISNAKVRA